MHACACVCVHVLPQGPSRVQETRTFPWLGTPDSHDGFWVCLEVTRGPRQEPCPVARCTRAPGCDSSEQTGSELGAGLRLLLGTQGPGHASVPRSCVEVELCRVKVGWGQEHLARLPGRGDSCFLVARPPYPSDSDGDQFSWAAQAGAGAVHGRAPGH